MQSKKKILYISLLAPYDKVDHAGGKVHNFYLKKMQESGNCDIRLLSTCWGWEVPLLDLDQYEIKNKVYVFDTNILHKNIRKLVSGISYYNPFDKYCNMFLDYERYHIKKMVRDYAKNNPEPDVIILQWTQIIFLINYVKYYYPNCKIIAIEEDVSFLNYQRRAESARSLLQRKISLYQYRKLKSLEINVLNKADIVVNNNHKDLLLLEDAGIIKDRLRELPVYFQSYLAVNRHSINKDILFYGNMNRPENYKSAIWFIEKVMPLIFRKDIRFLVVGSHPHKELLKKRGENIIIRGYVENVEPYFETCRCMVAPLVLGAGVKVKILEALSAGIPVLTNDIGIEGIYARNGEEYIHCNTPNEYADAINTILDNDDLAINENAKKFITTNYNLEDKFSKFMMENI